MRAGFTNLAAISLPVPSVTCIKPLATPLCALGYPPDSSVIIIATSCGEMLYCRACLVISPCQRLTVSGLQAGKVVSWLVSATFAVSCGVLINRANMPCCHARYAPPTSTSTSAALISPQRLLCTQRVSFFVHFFDFAIVLV